MDWQHRSDIDVAGFRSLQQGAEVEYTPVRGEDGRLKAVSVTGPDGSAPKTGSRPHSAGGRGRSSPYMRVPYPYVFAPYPHHASPGMMTGLYPQPQHLPYAAPAYTGARGAQGQLVAPLPGQGAPGVYGVPIMPMRPMQQHRHSQSQAPSAKRVRECAWRVVVHNLPWETSREELLEAFTDWNPVEAHIMTDRFTGQSKGYGLVGFNSEEDMTAAISGRHGSDIGDPARSISVRQDQFS